MQHPKYRPIPLVLLLFPPKLAQPVKFPTRVVRRGGTGAQAAGRASAISFPPAAVASAQSPVREERDASPVKEREYQFTFVC